jgi:hypothetical protein
MHHRPLYPICVSAERSQSGASSFISIFRRHLPTPMQLLSVYLVLLSSVNARARQLSDNRISPLAINHDFAMPLAKSQVLTTTNLTALTADPSLSALMPEPSIFDMGFIPPRLTIAYSLDQARRQLKLSYAHNTPLPSRLTNSQFAIMSDSNIAFRVDLFGLALIDGQHELARWLYNNAAYRQELLGQTIALLALQKARKSLLQMASWGIALTPGMTFLVDDCHFDTELTPMNGEQHIQAITLLIKIGNIKPNSAQLSHFFHAILLSRVELVAKMLSQGEDMYRQFVFNGRQMIPLSCVCIENLDAYVDIISTFISYGYDINHRFPNAQSLPEKLFAHYGYSQNAKLLSLLQAKPNLHALAQAYRQLLSALKRSQPHDSVNYPGSLDFAIPALLLISMLQLYTKFLQNKKIELLKRAIQGKKLAAELIHPKAKSIASENTGIRVHKQTNKKATFAEVTKKANQAAHQDKKLLAPNKSISAPKPSQIQQSVRGSSRHLKSVSASQGFWQPMPTHLTDPVLVLESQVIIETLHLAPAHRLFSPTPLLPSIVEPELDELSANTDFTFIAQSLNAAAKEFVPLVERMPISIAIASPFKSDTPSPDTIALDQSEALTTAMVDQLLNDNEDESVFRFRQ